MFIPYLYRGSISQLTKYYITKDILLFLLFKLENEFFFKDQ